MSFVDLFKSFHSRAIAEVYPASVRVLFDSFLYDFNAAYWSPELIYSERELSRLTGLSQSTIHRAIKFLSDRGIIKTWRTRNKTVVKLLGNAVPQPQPRAGYESTMNQTRINSESKSLISYTLNSVEEKTEDRRHPPFPPKGSGREGGDTKKALGLPETEDIFKVWIAETHRPLGASEKYELLELVEDPGIGYEKVKEAITQTKQTSPRMYPTFADFKKVLQGESLTSTTDKNQGGERKREFSKPVNRDKPWEK